MTSKYAALPDLDQNPDIYETPDLASDVSTLPTSSVPDENYDPDIEDVDLDLDAARARFQNAVVDARDADFSDRITSKRRAYAVSTRRGEDDEEDENITKEESVQRRLARLRREVEELRGELEEVEEEKRENGEGGYEEEGEEGKEKGEVEELEGGVEELAGALRKLAEKERREGSAPSVLARKLAKAKGVGVTATKEIPADEKEDGSVQEKTTTNTYTVTYAPDYKDTHTLAQIADFDQRLALLEKVLGASSTMTNLENIPSAHALIPTLTDLTTKLNTLSSASGTSLEASSRRIKTLVKESEDLARARKAAAEAAADAGVDPVENDETVAKINALYGVLPTIEGMSPVLPAVLERLRSLRRVHQDAGRAEEGLREVERRVEEMEVEVRKWEDTLVRVEGAVGEGREAVEGNVVKVEGWVRDLEERMGKLMDA